MYLPLLWLVNAILMPHHEPVLPPSGPYVDQLAEQSLPIHS